MLAARDGEPCGRQRTVRGDRGGDLRAHRRTDLAVEGQRDHRLHRGPFDRGDSRRHGDSAVVSTVLGDVGAGRVVVRQCGDYGHHLHVAGIVDAGEPCDARWRDSCGRLCSPVSTSALLIKQLTHTNLFNTIARMLRTGAVPFVLSCVVYVAAAVAEWLARLERLFQPTQAA